MQYCFLRFPHAILFLLFGALVLNCSGETGPICQEGETQITTVVCGLNDEGFVVEACTDGAWLAGEECTGTDECENGSEQDGSTVCGLNDEGVLLQDCTDGAWVDNETCTGVDVCVNGEARNGETVCGLNDEGVLGQDCTDGQWLDNETCTGTDECVNGDAQEGATVCGLNDEGVVMQDCTDGAWVDNETCTGTDVCVNGEGQEGATACGLNSEGVLMQDCTDGAWVDNETCTGTDICVNGTGQEGATACGLNSEGVLMQDCTDGAWVDNETCTGTHICVNGDGQEGPTACGLNSEGVLFQDCTDGGWVDNETCTGTDICVNGTGQEGATICGLNDEGVLLQDCTAGQWVENETCSGTDICVNETSQVGPTICGLNDEGTVMQNCEGGAWVDHYMDASCEEDSDWADAIGDNCAGYTVNPGWCIGADMYADENGVDASMVCCICGGGTTETIPNCTGTDICVNGTAQAGITICGLNDEGVLMQDCTAGAWVDNETCTGGAVCVNGEAQVGSTICGLNSEGLVHQNCEDGAWADDNTYGSCADDTDWVDLYGDGCDGYTATPSWCSSADIWADVNGVAATDVCCVCGGGTLGDPQPNCTGTDICVNETTQVGPTICGLNDEGTVMQNCEDGGWVDDVIECVDDDVWEDSFGDDCSGSWYADPDNCATASTYAVDGVDATMVCCTCGGGNPPAAPNCTGIDVCVNGEAQEGATVCGLNDEGVLIQDCTGGAWVDNETCTGTDICVNGSREPSSTACGFEDAGVLMKDCAAGAWSDDAAACVSGSSGCDVDADCVDVSSLGCDTGVCTIPDSAACVMAVDPATGEPTAFYPEGTTCTANDLAGYCVLAAADSTVSVCLPGCTHPDASSCPQGDLSACQALSPGYVGVYAPAAVCDQKCTANADCSGDTWQCNLASGECEFGDLCYNPAAGGYGGPGDACTGPTGEAGYCADVKAYLLPGLPEWVTACFESCHDASGANALVYYQGGPPPPPVGNYVYIVDVNGISVAKKAEILDNVGLIDFNGSFDLAGTTTIQAASIDGSIYDSREYLLIADFGLAFYNPGPGNAYANAFLLLNTTVGGGTNFDSFLFDATDLTGGRHVAVAFINADMALADFYAITEIAVVDDLAEFNSNAGGALDYVYSIDDSSTAVPADTCTIGSSVCQGLELRGLGLLNDLLDDGLPNGSAAAPSPEDPAACRTANCTIDADCEPYGMAACREGACLLPSIKACSVDGLPGQAEEGEPCDPYDGYSDTSLGYCTDFGVFAQPSRCEPW